MNANFLIFITVQTTLNQMLQAWLFDRRGVYLFCCSNLKIQAVKHAANKLIVGDFLTQYDRSIYLFNLERAILYTGTYF